MTLVRLNSRGAKAVTPTKAPTLLVSSGAAIGRHSVLTVRRQSLTTRVLDNTIGPCGLRSTCPSMAKLCLLILASAPTLVLAILSLAVVGIDVRLDIPPLSVLAVGKLSLLGAPSVAIRPLRPLLLPVAALGVFLSNKVLLFDVLVVRNDLHLVRKCRRNFRVRVMHKGRNRLTWVVVELSRGTGLSLLMSAPLAARLQLTIGLLVGPRR